MKIFETNGNIYKNAYLNWMFKKREPIYNLQYLAKNYIFAAESLTKLCLDDNDDHKADSLILPILFDVNMGIELYVKSLEWCLNQLVGDKAKYHKNHNIKKIWETTKEKIVRYGFNLSEGRGEEDFYSLIKPLEEYLEELYEKVKDINNEPKLDFTRFPYTVKNQEQFYVENTNILEIVNLEALLEMIEGIGKGLDALSGYYYELLRAKWDKSND